MHMHAPTTHNGIHNEHTHPCHATTSANILRISVTGEQRNLLPLKIDTGKSTVVFHGNGPHVAHISVVSCA
jgi:hypothetical protein